MTYRKTYTESEVVGTPVREDPQVVPLGNPLPDGPPRGPPAPVDPEEDPPSPSGPPGGPPAPVDPVDGMQVAYISPQPGSEAEALADGHDADRRPCQGKLPPDGVWLWWGRREE